MKDELVVKVWTYILITFLGCVVAVVAGISYYNYTFRIGGYCEQARIGSSAGTLWVKCETK